MGTLALMAFGGIVAYLVIQLVIGALYVVAAIGAVLIALLTSLIKIVVRLIKKYQRDKQGKLFG